VISTELPSRAVAQPTMVPPEPDSGRATTRGDEGTSITIGAGPAAAAGNTSLRFDRPVRKPRRV